MQPTSQTGGDGVVDAVGPEAAFGMRLRQAREQQGVSLRELARRLTRSHSNLWDYERGHRLATFEVTTEYERELGLPQGALQGPLEEARREVYGMHRDRRRPFRPPGPTGPALPSVVVPSAPVPTPPALAPETGPGPVVTPRPDLRPSGPFVGRDDELAAMRSWLDDAQAGEPRAVLVRGDAGIGKSTLVAHVLAEARGRGWLTLYGSCLQGARVAYLPLATALGPLRLDPRPAAGAPAALLDLFVGGEAPATGAESDIAAERRHLGLFVAAAHAVLDAADRQPLVLAIEDLHWSDDQTLGLLEHLTVVATQKSALSPVPLVLLLTSRRAPDGDAAAKFARRLEREVTCRAVDLEGLQPLEINQVVTEIGKARPAPPLLRSISEASRGNPLLLRSLLDRLMSDGTVAVHDGLLAGRDGPLPSVALDLDDELAARLERITGQCGDLLAWAALLGDRQRLDDLQLVSGLDDAAFDQTIELAAEGRVLYEDGEFYRFDHPQLREVLYARIPARQKRRKHLAVADCVEAAGDREGRDTVLTVAHHLRLAGAEAPPETVARITRVAAERSFALAAWSDAASYFDLCLAADARTATQPDAYLLWRAGLSHFRNHDHAQAEDRLGRAADAARAAGDERAWGRAVLALTRSRVTGGSWLGAEVDLQPIQDFLRDSNRDSDADDLRARAYSLLSDAYFAQFDFPAGFEHATRALEIARRVADDEVTAEVELALGIQHLAALHLDDAEKHLASCAASAARLNDSWARAWAASRIPLLLWCRGDLAAADGQAVSAAALASGHFDWAEASLANACRTAIAVAQGRLAPAERLGALARQQYLRSDYLWTLLVLAPALVAGRAFRGREGAAREAIGLIGLTGIDTGIFDLAVRAILGEVDTVRAGQNEPPVLAQTGPPFSLFDLAFAALKVEICDLTDDPDVARAALGPLEAAQAAGFANVVGWVASVPRLLGVVYRCLGRYQESEQSLRQAIADCERAPAPVELARTRLNLAQVLTRVGDDASATIELDEAATAFRALGLDALHARAERLRPAVADPTA